MHSQSLDSLKPEYDKSQARSSNANNITSKSTNNSIVSMNKRKQNPIHQMKNSPTTDVQVVNVLQKASNTPVKSMNSNSPMKHVTQSKPHQITTVRQMPRASHNGTRNELSDDQPYQLYQGPPSPYAPSSTTIPITISTPHIGTPHSNFRNQFNSYASQVPVQLPHADITNRPNYVRHYPSHNNKKNFNYSKSRRNNNSSSSNKMHNPINNNNNSNSSTSSCSSNNSNNNEFDSKNGNRINNLGARNSHRSFNCETGKNISPSHDHYSSSSSSSLSSLSVPLNKKNSHHIASAEDSRIGPMAYGAGYDRSYFNGPWTHNPYIEDYQSHLMPYDWSIADSIGRSGHQLQFHNPSNGDMLTITSDGKSQTHRINKSNRGHHKNGSNIKRSPADRFMTRAPQIEIKEIPRNLTNGSRWDRLSKQVHQRFMDHQQREDTYKKKMVMWKNVHCIVQGSFSEYSLYVVGSTISGFGTDFSDVDMCLVHSAKNGPYIGNEFRIHSSNILKAFEDLLRRNPIYNDFNLIHAKVPILRFKDTFHEFEIDLNYNNYVGVQNTHLLYCYGKMDWRLRPLAVVVKLWARHHGINNAKESTISSYSLVLMVIHFLQCGVTPAVLPCLHEEYPNKFQRSQEIKTIDMHEDLPPWYSTNKQPLGELLVQFFKYYTNFDFTTQAISVRKGCTISIESCRNNSSPKNDPNQWKELCIEEPFDFTNTAHSCYDPQKFQLIRSVFSMTYSILSSSINPDLQDVVPVKSD